MLARTQMSRGVSIAVVVAVLALVMLLGDLARAAPPRLEGAPQVELTVDTATLEPELGERLGQALDERVVIELRRRGVDVVTGPAPRRLEVGVAMPDTEQREYTISLVLTDGPQAEVLVEALRCPVCSEAAVVDQTAALLPIAVGRLTAAPEPDASTPAQSRASPRRQLGPVGVSGIATLASGTASILAGVAIGPAHLEYGIGFIGAGAAALALGAAAIAIDVTVLDRRRRQRQLGLGLGLGRGRWGLVFAGRF